MTTQPIIGSSPVLIQSRFGTQGNFELLSTYQPPGLLGSGFAHYWRNNDDPPTYPWSLPTAFGAGEGPPFFLAPTMIESNFGSPGNLEVICVPGSVTGPKWFVYFWRDSGPAFTGSRPSKRYAMLTAQRPHVADRIPLSLSPKGRPVTLLLYDRLLSRHSCWGLWQRPECVAL